MGPEVDCAPLLNRAVWSKQFRKMKLRLPDHTCTYPAVRGLTTPEGFNPGWVASPISKFRGISFFPAALGFRPFRHIPVRI